MKKKNMLVAALMGASFVMYGQTIHYKTVEDDPYNIRKLVLHIDPFYFDMAPTNLTMGFGARLDMHYGSLGTLNIDFRKAYWDMVQAENKADKDIKKQLWLEGMASVNLSNKTRRKDLKITLSSTTVGNVTYEKFFFAPGQMRTIVAVRGGAFYHNCAYKASNSSNYGTYFMDGTDTLRPQTAAMFNVVTLAGGLSVQKITNLLVSVDDWGTYRHARYSDFYVDFLFAPGVATGKADFTTTAGLSKPDEKVEVEKKKHIGWRMGWLYKNSYRSSFSYRLELGNRPGLGGTENSDFSPGWFMMMTMGWSVPFKTKF